MCDDPLGTLQSPSALIVNNFLYVLGNDAKEIYKYSIESVEWQLVNQFNGVDL